MTETAVQEQITTAITNIGPADVEVDTSYENDSTYGDELSSYSASLTSSVLEYRHENGRRYHKYRDGAYLLPNDESENDRLDMVHEMFLLLLHGKLYLAPIKNPQRVMDLATGTGLWAIDFADQHPPAEVIGCDLSPIQPTLVPPNLKFLVDDLTSDWEYESNPFDFIHARYLCFSFKDIGKLVKQCYRSVKPGGWVEFQDWDAYPISQDGSLSGTDLEKYYNEVYGAFEKTGVEVRPGIKLEQWFKDAGFVNIQVEKFVIPYGVWPKDARLKKVGAWAQIQAEASGYESVAMAVLTRFENWKKEEVQILANKASADARRRDIHMMFNFYVVYGQRPEK
ncbi:hypothetical protein VTN49DRAFT_2605 [Thermomyces lanuginosus]|uniref:uncharacterized protein n=1 Tax=Thermomyces lanuginosus TaxID=5541 RepID=UPI003744219C